MFPMENTLCLLLLKVPQWSNLHVTVAAGKVTHLFPPPWLLSPGEEPGNYVSYHLHTGHPRFPPALGTFPSFFKRWPLFPVRPRRSFKASLCRELEDSTSSVLTLCSCWLLPISKQGPPLVSSLVPLGAGRGGQLPKADSRYALPTSAGETRSRVMECVQG